MPITLPVQAVADNKSFDKVADRAERKFTKAGQDSGKAFTKGLNDAASKADPKAVEKWTKAYDKVADSAGKVRVEETKLADLRNRGASNARLIAQSEALQRARRAEARATREATNTYRELEQASSGTGIRSAGRDAAIREKEVGAVSAMDLRDCVAEAVDLVGAGQPVKAVAGS